MPKVISYTPPWLSRPSPGASLFADTATKGVETTSQKLRKDFDYTGPSRTLAQRGNEVFAVVNNRIRWSDLTRLKDQWQQQTRSQEKTDSSRDVHYRELLVPVYDNIRQLIPSPDGVFLAVVADHTVYIVVLPDPSHLSGTDSNPIRVKYYQLGPTTHVIPESPVASALWHPLGANSTSAACIVTVTVDAAVRVWELDRNDHWSFDRPSLAIDLRKLVDGTSSDQDFAPSGFGKNKGFSADYVDMEVASACFGGSGSEKEDAWAPMTLWIAMKPGDLYALCPLLPSKWRAPATTVPSLSADIIPKLAASQEDPSEAEDELVACQQQYDWLAEIDNQDPLHVQSDPETGASSEILTRPANPSAIPRLQGPFRIDTGDEVEDLDLCDILVTASKLDTDTLMKGEDVDLALDDNGDEKLSATIICLSTGSGRVHICLELDGVEGQWLPRAKKNAFRTPTSDPSDLLLVESLDTVKGGQASIKNWPTFTRDAHSPYSFFVTNEKNVVFLSLSSWVQRLEAELASEDTSGSAFRLEVLCEGTVSLREQILELDGVHGGATEQAHHFPSSLVYDDYGLGYLLLTYHTSHPYAAVMDAPVVSLPSVADRRPFDLTDHTPWSPVFPPRRPPYQVPAVFYSESPLEFFVDKHVPHRERVHLKEQVRLSPATLDIVAAAHRILSAHTNALERAASDLFRRCERLQGEMRDQLKQFAHTAQQIKEVSSKDAEKRNGESRNEALDKRMQAAKDRQEQLVKRYEALRTRVLRSGGRPLSEKEKSWVSEVQTLSESFESAPSESRENGQQITQRIDSVKDLASDLVADAKSIAAKTPVSVDPGSPASPGGSQPRVPHRLQRAKVADAMQMVELESAMIDAITSRLGRLNASV
ncbi:uncharacterized protein LDX57_003271 [Aspergillus melleus]|uniref:uncharacterized protein n=1 Tax=Aspergillus melleus TaxID=138277 RepID=UPI001E8D7C1B|nr:uncharacterized protein LDX57_003271 [Aspergillus melleus]KAH8425520.1 hypothetical protein LDX57_003271 [Aspergillus melleus]